MKEQLVNILESIKKEIKEADVVSKIEDIRVRFLGKKGELTKILRSMGSLSAEERPVIGAFANKVREEAEALLKQKTKEIKDKELSDNLKNDVLDITLPGEEKTVGTLHPLTQVENDLAEIFLGMGFSIVEGPEVESVKNNFDALNAPFDHPSREYSDTFYITPDTLLRTQTSPVQIRAMHASKPPIRIISPGRVYRSDAVDGTHSPMFHQLEGLVVDEGITMGDLRGTLELFAKNYFGPDTRIRFRPHNFPFTEPSAEVDVSCFICGGKGCKLCKGEGWIEILGAGMVHPNVLKGCGIDTDKYSGFAFGIGLERVVMIKYGIEDMRYLYENDSRFLKQF
ncbi:MAG: phenylalanine--tRNA ligase subunit alpha [Clostridia bacterium]|nr:phenylalanine--tRNA ligase subunit alpha [Clostridia bacterium]